ncbi:hypothetical protein ACSBR2_039062 [Camellia fascicularis]
MNSVRIVCQYSSRHLVALQNPKVSPTFDVVLSRCRVGGMADRKLYSCSRIQSLVHPRSSTSVSPLSVRRSLRATVAPASNRADPGSADVTFRTPLAPYEKSKFLGSGGSMVTRLKLKGIDRRAPPGVEPAA